MSLQMADIGDIDGSDWGAVEEEPGDGSASRIAAVMGTGPNGEKLQTTRPALRSSLRYEVVDTDPLSAMHEDDDEESVIRLPTELTVSNGDGFLAKRSSTLFETMLAGDPDSFLSLESRFQSSIIDELDLVQAPQTTVRGAIDSLETLRLDVLRYSEKEEAVNSDSIKKRIEEILTSIAREIALYEQFLNPEANKFLNLSNILQSQEFAGDEDIMPSPKGPPTDTASEYSTVNTKRMSYTSPNRRSSISSIGSGPSRTSTALFPYVNGNGNSVPAQLIPPGPHDIFRWTPLHALSDSILSDSMIQKVGVPTVFAVSGGIVIGTNRSMILVYDLAQSLKIILGDFATAAEHGAVTAIAISPKQTRIACGYALGDIIIWDVVKGVVFRSIKPRIRSMAPDKPDGHVRGVAITHISFINGNTEVIAADKEGSVFYHSISKVLMIKSSISVRLQGQPHQSKSAAIFSVSALPHSQSSHFTDSRGLMAITSPYRLIVLCTKPVPAIIYKMPWFSEKNSSTSEVVAISCLAWLPSFKPTDGNAITVSDPILAVSSGKRLQILRLQGRGTDPKQSKLEVDFVVEGEWSASTNIVGLQWVNSQFIGVLVNSEDLILVDSFSFRATETCDIKSKRLVSHDYYSKSVEGLGLQSEMAYHQSFRSFKGRLFFLTCKGLANIEVASPLSWVDRLTALVRTGSFEEAIRMALGYYRGDSEFAATGLPLEDSAREKIVGDYISGLIQTYSSMALSSYEGDDKVVDEDALTSLSELCIEVCVSIRREDILFAEIYDKFAEVEMENIFLENLEPFILEDRVTMLDNPVVLSNMITLYQQRSWLARLEQVILHLDPFSLDIHGVLGICKEYGLMSALIYVYNRAVQDFVTPVIELLKLIETVVKGTDVSLVGTIPLESRCYTLFIYLAYALTGKAFPIGSLSKKESLRAKTDIYNFLFSEEHVQWPPELSRAEKVVIGEEPLPYIRTLLQYDAPEFLKVLALAFDDLSLDGEIRKRDGWSADGKVRFADQYAEFNRQTIITALVNASEHPEITRNQQTIVELHLFLAKMFIKHRKSITLTDESLDTIVEILISAGSETGRNDRQTAIINILEIFSPTNIDIASDAFIVRCESMRLWRVCEYLHRRSGKFSEVLRCYLLDDSRKFESFHCLRELLTNDVLTYAQTWEVKETFLKSIAEFITLDSRDAAQVILDLLPGDINIVIEKLQGEPQTLFRFFAGFLDDGKDPRRGHGNTSGEIDHQQKKTFPQRFYQRYIELMCQYHPGNVAAYLAALSESLESDPYPIEKILQLCLEKDIAVAALWLYERMGDFSGALDLIIKLLDAIFAKVVQEVDHVLAADMDDDTASKQTSVKSQVTQIRTFFESAMGLIKKSNGKIPKEDRTSLWLRLLDVVLRFQTEASANTDAGKPASSTLHAPKSPLDAKQFLAPSREPSPSRGLPLNVWLAHSIKAVKERLISELVGQVNASAVLGRILQTTGSQATFGSQKDTIFCMLESHSYEQDLLGAVTRTQGEDVFSLFARARKLRLKPFRPSKGQCLVCRRALHTDALHLDDLEDSIVVFQCRHSFHMKCLHDQLTSELSASTLSVFSGKASRDPDIPMGYAWCIACDRSAMHAGLVKKKRVISTQTPNKGKRPMDSFTEFNARDDVSPGVNAIEHLYSAFEKLPSSSAIFAALKPTNEVEEDRIEMNDGFSGRASADGIIVHDTQRHGNGRQLPTPVLQLLGIPLNEPERMPRGQSLGADSGLEVLLSQLQS
ncbi:Vacuolar protein sorting-associated protein 8 [Phlyctochytrium planicorne]|nr:Vacuolar protein sorting-associated protein 8 [Phlyctochytrium planicorne]